MKKNKNSWAFFGTSNFSVIILEELKRNGIIPSLIVTTTDKPKGRKLILTSPEVKIWAEKERIPYIQLASLKSDNVMDIINSYEQDGYDFFVVASYGKIIPRTILDIPKFGVLNVHPSLLPKLRGASPIQNAILYENETGVTIIKLDVEMDHGPIIAQRKILSWDNLQTPYAEDLEKKLAHEGGKMLVEILPNWLSGKIDEKEQKHSEATFCGKIEKENGHLNLDDSPEMNLRKIRAYHLWPGAYYFINKEQKKIRVIIKRAHINDNNLVIDRVVPEGKREMNYSDFLKGLKLH